MEPIQYMRQLSVDDWPFCEKDVEEGEDWVTSDAFDWGDYIHGSSDMQCANAIALPKALGLKTKDASVLYRRERGHRSVRIWIRISPPPREDEWAPRPKRNTTRQELWTAKVLRVFARLDDYPLLDDEVHSRMLEDWCMAAWKDHGKHALRQKFVQVVGELGLSVDEAIEVFEKYGLFSWPSILRAGGEYKPFDAEGGEGGIYFHIATILSRVVGAGVSWYYCETPPTAFERKLWVSLILHLPHAFRHVTDSACWTFTFANQDLQAQGITPRRFLHGVTTFADLTDFLEFFTLHGSPSDNLLAALRDVWLHMLGRLPPIA